LLGLSLNVYYTVTGTFNQVAAALTSGWLVPKQGRHGVAVHAAALIVILPST